MDRHAPFYPHPLLRDKHVMTIAGAKLPRPVGPFAGMAEEFWLPVDEATSVRVEMHWQRDPDAPVLVLVHGLSGCASSPYMLGAAQKAFARGMSVLRLNIRNCGGTAGQTPTLYNAAFTDDLHALVAWLGRHHPRSPVYVAGFSLGGSIVLHAAAQGGDAPPAGVRALAAVSTPLNLVNTCRAMHAGVMNRMYMRRFLDGFVTAMHAKARAYPELYPADAGRGYRDFYSFDEQWTAPHFGYRSANEYYNRASAFRILHEVRIPGLVLQAEDDPLVPFDRLSLDALHANPRLRLVVSRWGGHNAFFAAEPAETESWKDADRWWAENRIVQYFAQLHSGGQAA